jgi:hypothetical protein
MSCLLLVRELSNFRLHTDMCLTKICNSMSDRHNITDSVMYAYGLVRVKRNDGSSNSAPFVLNICNYNVCIGLWLGD